MEQICPVCGLSKEENERVVENKIIRICEKCLKNKKLSQFLDQLFP